jgi:DNA polymerase III subunit gamma/tau
VRDGLSLLDQAIVQDQGQGVSGPIVRDMLGLADRTRTFDLLEAILKGDAKGALVAFSDQYERGAEPAIVLRDVLDLTHDVARGDALGSAWQPVGPSDQIARMRGFAKASSPAALSRLWQMLLRGFEEAGRAPDPVQAAEMCLLRVCAALQLPPPEDLARLLAGQGAAPSQQPAPTTSQHAPQASGQAPESEAGAHASSPFPTFESFLEALEDARETVLQVDLERFVRVVSFAPNNFVFEPLHGAPADLQRRTAECLSVMSGADWIVELGEGGQESIVERNKRLDLERLKQAEQDPLVISALKAFPGAKVIEVRPAPVIESLPSADMDEDNDGDDEETTNVVEVDFGQRRMAE